MIPFAVGQPEQPLLDDRSLPVPERQREAEPLLIIRDSRQPILAPVICARAGLIVAEVSPGVPVLAVVLAHCAPLPLAQVGAPFLPRQFLISVFFQSNLLCV